MKNLRLLLSLIVLAVLPSVAQVKPTLAVLGDSYSTFAGFIPKGNACWYNSPADHKRTDVTKVEQTWWWQVANEGGYKLGAIESYSGATICNTGYRDEDYSDRSFVTRCTNLGNPDIILICGATNDSWANAPIGDYKYANWKRVDLYFFRPAMAKMLNDVKLHYPNVEVYFILNTELKKEINESVLEICKHYDVPVIELVDIDKKSSHPSVKGMKAIAQQVLKFIKK